MAALLCLAPAGAQIKKKGPPPTIGEVTIDQYKTLYWEPDTNHFQSPGHVRIILEDANTHEKTILVADDAEGSPTGDIIVKGNLRLERPEGNVTGRALTYRATERTGTLLDAKAAVANVLLSGAKLELLPNQDVRAYNASFTTCIKPKPDYHITAKEISIDKNQTVRAKHITFFLGGMRIISLPSLKKSFKKTVENPIPMPGYSRENFVQIRFHDDLLDEPKNYFNYDVVLSPLRTPQATLNYETDLGKPDPDQAPPRTRRFLANEPLRTALETTPALLKGSVPEDETKRASLYGLLSTGIFVYNRVRTDLRVARLPEVGVSFRNIMNRKPPVNGDEPRSVFGTGFFSPANWLVNAEAGLGYFQESPTHTRDTRFGFRADATTPLFRVSGPVYVRYGGTTWVNLYGNHNAYTLLSPEAEVDVLLRPNTLIGAAYRYQQDFGKTPFLFDRRDVKHELRLRYDFLGAHWAYDTEIKYDMERLRAYDSTFAIRRRLDCMEFGLAYRTRNQSVSLILNLLPGQLHMGTEPTATGTGAVKRPE